MIAFALAKRPQLLICDEPVLALDSELQEQNLKLLKNLQIEYGLSLIFIDHHLNLVSQFCDEVLILNKGKLGGLIRSQGSLLKLCHEDWSFLASEKSPQGFGQDQFSTGCR
jgi:ABC-type glutathione transport system ATPase component